MSLSQRFRFLAAPFLAVAVITLASLAGCTKPANKTESTIKIDGSSTVFPVTQAMAEQFMEEHPGVKITVGLSGTGGGFKKFVVGETDINDSSRPISEKEMAQTKENGIEYLELAVAIDGLTVVVNKNNDWCECLSVEQLKAIWEPGSKIQKWSDLDPSWPDKEIVLYGADSDSGTFDYFTEVIVGKAKSSRTDYNASADDNQLVVGVEGDQYSLGYFGYAYYTESADRLKAVGIIPAGAAEAPKTDGAQGADPRCVLPTSETILSGAYSPLSRPLFLHVNKESLQRPEVAAFLRFYLTAGQPLVNEVGYIQLDEAARAASLALVEDAAPAAAKKP